MPIELAEDDALCDTGAHAHDPSDLTFALEIAKLSRTLPQAVVTLPVKAEAFQEHIDAYLDVIDAGAIIPITFEGQRYVALSESQLRAICRVDDLCGILGAVETEPAKATA